MDFLCLLCAQIFQQFECFLAGFVLFGLMGFILPFDWQIAMSSPLLFSNLIIDLVVISSQGFEYFLNISLEIILVSLLVFSCGCKVIFSSGLTEFKGL